MRPIIKVEQVSKQYRLGGRDASYATLRDALIGAIRSPFRKNAKPTKTGEETIWALKDVSFDVQPGEVVGIIGRNGAGKSTLLKVLSRIVEPTTGSVKLYGRVGSLLEVGTGFHPELSGRENIYLNGAILGMKRVEIEKKFDEIVAFAEIEKFIDTPVKHYSSGMYMRLAFAVAAHLEPEILIVDEVLAVGDAAFQKKCLEKMRDVGQHGRTVLFVSHNLTAIKTLCDRAIWLEQGIIKEDDAASKTIPKYLQSSAASVLGKVWELSAISNEKNPPVQLRSVRISPAEPNAEKEITVRTPLKIEIEYWNNQEGALLNLSIVLYNLEGFCILNSVSEPLQCPAGWLRQVCHIPGNFLNDETYTLRVLVVKDTCLPLIDEHQVAMFEVHDVKRDGKWFGKWVGVVRPDFQWTTEVVNSDAR